MRIGTDKFQGMAPLQDPRNLADSQAQMAIDCDLRESALHPIRNLTLFMQLPNAGTQKTVYQYTPFAGGNQTYPFAWIDDVDVVKGAVPEDANQLVFWTGDTGFAGPRLGGYGLSTGGASYNPATSYPTNSRPLGLPVPPLPTNLGVTPGAGTGPIEQRSYVFTYVNDLGMESQPSPPLLISCRDGDLVSIGFGSLPAGYNFASAITTPQVNLYRTVATGSGTFYFYVRSTGASAAAENLLDAVVVTQGQLESLDWAPPVATLKGLRNMGNGIIAAWDNATSFDLYFCEPYRPWAWPVKYSLTVDFTIVGLGVFMENLVVCTSGKPYIGIGSDPASINLKPVDSGSPCLSKRGIVEFGNGVMYPTVDGLAWVGADGTYLHTAGVIDIDWWATINPTSITGVNWDGRYIGFFDGSAANYYGSKAGFIYDLATKQLTMLDFWADAAFRVSDAINRFTMFHIHASYSGVSSGNWYFMGLFPDIFFGNFACSWKSKKFETPHPTNFGWLQVISDQYPVSPITVQVWGDGISIGTFNITSRSPVRLPAGYQASFFEVQINMPTTNGTPTGGPKIKEVWLAHSTKDLRREAQ